MPYDALDKYDNLEPIKWQFARSVEGPVSCRVVGMRTAIVAVEVAMVLVLK